MKPSYWEVIIVIVVIAIFFVGGYQTGKATGYDDGFEEGATAAEEYAKECYNNLDNDIKTEFGVSAYDAALVINKYDGTQDGTLLFNEYSDVVNAHYALEYFYNNLWYKLCNVSEVAIDIADINND